MRLASVGCATALAFTGVLSFATGVAGLAPDTEDDNTSLFHGFDGLYDLVCHARAIDEHRWVRSFVGATGRTLHRI